MALIDEMQASMKIGMQELAEDVTYNGNTVKAIPEIGADLAKLDIYDVDALAGISLFEVFAADLTDKPTAGDSIIYKGQTYKVKSIQEYDSLANAYLLNVVSNVRGFGRA